MVECRRCDRTFVPAPDALPWSDEGPETRWPPAVRAIIFLVSASAAWMAVIEAAVLIFG